MAARVLLTGATGYIGGRLLRSLEGGGVAVRCLTRRPRAVSTTRPTTEVVRGDCLDEASLDGAFEGIDSAYYLVHSMDAGRRFAELDRLAARNFCRAAARAGVRRIIYLGGLADDISSLSTHLRSRAETGEALREGGVPVTELRASIVIGAGSLSFEMIRALVERLPLMICPRWVSTPAQPIAIDDVLAYLVAALDLPTVRGRVFEIGGPDVVSYGDIMREYARLRGLRRFLLPVPLLTPRLSGLWLALVTPAQSRVGRALVDGLKNASVVRSGAARDVFRIEPMPLSTALARAIDDGERHDTSSPRADRPGPAETARSACRTPGRDAAGPEFTHRPAARGRAMRLGSILLCAALMATAAQGQEQPPVRTVEAVDLNRYVGHWFEIARFPNRFQQRCAGDVTATYARRADGRLDVINKCRTADGAIEAAGVARIVDTRTSAKLEVRFAPAALSFLPFVWGDYWIVGLAGDYSWAVVGSPDREYLWVLSRTPVLDAGDFASALAAARASGFDVSRLVGTTHTPPRAGRSS
jgi:lipocalin/uncharacterized protein YbjT (DUF2867 family)